MKQEGIYYQDAEEGADGGADGDGPGLGLGDTVNWRHLDR